MDNVYLILVVVLFALAISDLIVGVSNDAVNFLNSAIGAKAAPFKIIMAIAAVGILVGTTFSSGMMEVARKGIFHPEHFYFSEIMIIFLAVMITDIILLDTFNTFGMPTSTTVSIVFELLGAAVSVAIVKISSQPEALITIAESLGIDAANITVSTFINTDKAVLIIAGILLSVIVAFSIGAIVQWISRLIFSFKYQKSFKYYGAIWGGFAITAITYFILVKGIKGSSYAEYEVATVFNGGDILAWVNQHLNIKEPFSSIEEMIKGLKGKYIWNEKTSILTITLKQWVSVNAVYVILYSFIAWSIILQIFQFLKINILKIIVFVGTFALAMAFASNDLVNFIGVPLAGFHAYQDWSATPGADPTSYLMSGLKGKVDTQFFLLLLAGFIMVITLWLSKKARSVVKTSLDLSRQEEGDERFGSSVMARNIVRATRKTAKATKKVMPTFINKYFDKKFDTTDFKKQQTAEKDPPAFDMIRASVNLVVASILISIGTNYKLPLSTTYVTFMVAMGTSLADKAWSKESAVFRVTGVISVIGGWFFTAFSAFSVAFLVALLFSYAGLYSIFGLLAIVLFILFRSHLLHKKRVVEQGPESNLQEIEESNIVEKCTLNITDTLNNVSIIIDKILDGLTKEDRKILKEANKDVNVLNKQAKYLKDNVYKTITKLDRDSIKTGHYYVQVLDYLRETAHALTFISKPSLDHVDNNFGELLDIQIEELNQVSEKIKGFYKEIIEVINTKNYDKVPDVIELQQKLIEESNEYRILQIRRVKNKEAGTKNSMLYLGILHEVKNLLLNGINLLKAQRDFDNFKKK